MVVSLVVVSSNSNEGSATACLLMNDHTDALNWAHKKRGVYRFSNSIVKSSSILPES